MSFPAFFAAALLTAEFCFAAALKKMLNLQHQGEWVADTFNQEEAVDSKGLRFVDTYNLPPD